MKLHRISPDALRPGGDEYFIGEARVQPLLGEADGIDVVVVSFSPGARTYLPAPDAPPSPPGPPARCTGTAPRRTPASRTSRSASWAAPAGPGPTRWRRRRVDP